MADHAIRIERSTDPARFLATDKLVWFDETGSEPLELQLRGVPEDQRFAAELEGIELETHAAVYGVRPMELSVPDGAGSGRLVPMAGLTWVGVHPDARRRGLLTAMLRHHFEQTRAEGVHVSGLHASEPAIYGRHGYGLASLELDVELGRGTTFTAPHLEEEVAAVETHFLTLTDDFAERRRDCDRSVAEDHVGTVVGDREFYEEMCHASPEELRGNEPGRILFATRDGADVGNVVLRRTHKWERGRPGATVDVSPLQAGPAARLALLRRLVDLDLAGTIKMRGLSEGDPLFSWVEGPRATGDVDSYDSLWVRLVDLPAALALRGYEGDDCDVVVEVTDEAAPWNAGRWRIRVTAGEGAAERTEADADLSLPTSALGAAYLGGGNLVTRQRAGTVAEHRPGAVRELWRALRTDTAPYAARGF